MILYMLVLIIQNSKQDEFNIKNWKDQIRIEFSLNFFPQLRAYLAFKEKVTNSFRVPGVPKKVHKFEIKNLCSENKVGVIC